MMLMIPDTGESFIQNRTHELDSLEAFPKLTDSLTCVALMMRKLLHIYGNIGPRRTLLYLLYCNLSAALGTYRLTVILIVLEGETLQSVFEKANFVKPRDWRKPLWELGKLNNVFFYRQYLSYLKSKGSYVEKGYVGNRNEMT